MSQIEQKYTIRQFKVISQYDSGVYNHKKLNGKITFNGEYGDTALQLSLDSELSKEIMKSAIEIIYKHRKGKVVEDIQEKLVI